MVMVPYQSDSVPIPYLRGAYTLSAMRWFFGFLVVLLLIGGGMKLAGMELPIIDFGFDGLFGQPQIEIMQPDLNLP